MWCQGHPPAATLVCVTPAAFSSKTFWPPGKASKAGAACTPCHLAVGLPLTLDVSRPRAWVLGSRDQGWTLDPGPNVRCSPFNPHLAPLFSKSLLTQLLLGKIQIFSISSPPHTLTSYPLPLLSFSKRPLSPLYLFILHLPPLEWKPSRAGGFICLLAAVFPGPTQ